MPASRFRTVFIFGTLLGLAAGAFAAMRKSDQSARQTRDQIQQSFERILFKVLDMAPYQNKPTDTVTSTKPGAESEKDPLPPVDVVIGSRPIDANVSQQS